jgi:hypothetical protein
LPDASCTPLPVFEKIAERFKLFLVSGGWSKYPLIISSRAAAGANRRG